VEAQEKFEIEIATSDDATRAVLTVGGEVVTDPAAFPALRVGGGIWLDRQSQRASLDGKTACCKISKEGALDR